MGLEQSPVEHHTLVCMEERPFASEYNQLDLSPERNIPLSPTILSVFKNYCDLRYQSCT